MLQPDRPASIDVRFADAHEAWAAEVRLTWGGNPYAHLGKASARGEPGTPLRLAYETRETTFSEWCVSRGLKVSQNALNSVQQARSQRLLSGA